MAKKITDKKIEEMWEAFQEKQTLRYIGRRCKVSLDTVRKYREKGKWDERLAAIRDKANKKADESVAQMLARQAKHAREIQAKAKAKIIKGGFKAAKDATDAYFKATQEERVVRGEPGERMEVTLLEKIKEKHARRSKA